VLHPLPPVWRSFSGLSAFAAAGAAAIPKIAASSVSSFVGLFRLRNLARSFSPESMVCARDITRLPSAVRRGFTTRNNTTEAVMVIMIRKMMLVLPRERAT
jgi:hypothetical protein